MLPQWETYQKLCIPKSTMTLVAKNFSQNGIREHLHSKHFPLKIAKEIQENLESLKRPENIRVMKKNAF